MHGCEGCELRKRWRSRWPQDVLISFGGEMLAAMSPFLSAHVTPPHGYNSQLPPLEVEGVTVVNVKVN